MAAQRQFRENTILWIEDEWKKQEVIASLIVLQQSVIDEFGRCNITSIDINDKVEDIAARSSIDVMVQQVGNEPYLVNMRTAQLARTYLEQYIPGAIICDSDFPLNGKAVVGWLKAHGLDNYPLIGYSGRNFNELERELQQFFTQTSAVYIQKSGDGTNWGNIANHAAFSRRYVLLMKDRK